MEQHSPETALRLHLTSRTLFMRTFRITRDLSVNWCKLPATNSDELAACRGLLHFVSLLTLGRLQRTSEKLSELLKGFVSSKWRSQRRCRENR